MFQAPPGNASLEWRADASTPTSSEEGAGIVDSGMSAEPQHCRERGEWPRKSRPRGIDHARAEVGRKFEIRMIGVLESFLLFALLSMDTDFDLESLVNVEQTCVFSHLESPKPS